MRLFKQRQLDNDYNKEPEGFYLDIYNRWISCLQSPQARASSLFLFDVDEKDAVFMFTIDLMRAAGVSIIRDSYETKNGAHIITDPFEYPKLLEPEWHGLLQKNAMMLWAY